MDMGNVGALRTSDPRRVGSYELVGRLGEGGQGTVYLGKRAEDDEDGPRYAIKLLHADLTDDTVARARFLREVDLAKQVASFCTAAIVEAGVADERPFIVSEYVDGPSLRRHVETSGTLSGGVLKRLAIGTATALVAIHQAGVVHRDLKPANVLLGPDGPRVIDFGIARGLDTAVTVSSQVIGTPAYMAPEQLRGAPAGEASDIFAWASVMLYATAGTPPFGSDTIPAVVNRILHEEPDLDGVADTEFRALLAACLDKEAGRRPTARQVLMRLLGQDDSGGEPTRTRVDSAVGAATLGWDGADGATRPRSLGRRRWVRGAVAALVAAAAVTGIAIWVTAAGQPAHNTEYRQAVSSSPTVRSTASVPISQAPLPSQSIQPTTVAPLPTTAAPSQSVVPTPSTSSPAPTQSTQPTTPPPTTSSPTSSP